MGNAQSNEQAINVAYVSVFYTNNTVKEFRIPLDDEENVDSPYATYSRVVEAIASSFNEGRDAFIQLAKLDDNNEMVLSFISLWNVNDIDISVKQEVI